jgi:hypothetical protein
MWEANDVINLKEDLLDSFERGWGEDDEEAVKENLDDGLFDDPLTPDDDEDEEYEGDYDDYEDKDYL